MHANVPSCRVDHGKAMLTKVLALLCLAQLTISTEKAACTDNPGCKSDHANQGTECAKFIHIAGLFPLSGSLCFEGIQAAGAAKQAVEDINTIGGEIDHELLTDHCVVMHIRDTQGKPPVALYAADGFINTPWTAYANIDLFIGGMTSEVTETVQQLLQWPGIPQISYGSTSPTLSDKEKFPTVIRTVPSDAEMVDGVVKLFQIMEWEKITILAIDSEFGLAGAALMRQKLAEIPNSRMEVVASHMYNDGNIASILDEISQEEGRIIFLHTTVADAEVVLTRAYGLGMLQTGWAWIGSDWAQTTLFDDFKSNDLDEVLKIQDASTGLIAVRPAEEETATTRHVKQNLARQESQGDINTVACNHNFASDHVNSMAYFAYDAVIVGATAIHRAVEENGREPSNFTATMEQLKLMEEAEEKVTGGATGPIHIDKNGDRVIDYEVVNLIDGEWVVVGSFHPTSARVDLLSEGENADDSKIMVFPGGSTQIPSDRSEGHVSLAAMYLFTMMLFLVASICLGNFLHAHHFYYLPESGAVVLMGLIFGAVLNFIAAGFKSVAQMTEMTEFDTEMFNLILLPIIIFSAGFNLKKGDLWRNIVPILLCAFIGTAISSCVIAYPIWVLSGEGYFEYLPKIGVAESLAFGSLVSAVDPVATLAVFGALGVETDLNIRVFGESVINDGVSIVLFRVFTRYIAEEATGESVVGGIGLFFYIVIGSVFVGCLVALILAVMLKYARMHSHILEAAMIFLASYSAFSGAEALHMSGIIASLFCGIGMNHWTYHNFSYDGEVLARRTLKMGSLMADTVIFFQVGQNIVVNVVHPDWKLIGVTLVLCLIGRVCNILPLTNLYNICAPAERRIPFKQQLIMIHAGLRGAIAFALALDFPSQNKHVILNTTMWVILFTIFVLGGTCTSALGALNIEMGVESRDVQDSKTSRHSKELVGLPQKIDRLGILPCVTWRFLFDGSDSYIEQPMEARANRKGIPWPPVDGEH